MKVCVLDHGLRLNVVATHSVVELLSFSISFTSVQLRAGRDLIFKTEDEQKF